MRRPYRMALAHLRAAGIDWADDLPCVRACPPDERRLLERQLERDLNCVPTSSMGRLFDAVVLARRGLPPRRVRGPGRDRAGGARPCAPPPRTGPGVHVRPAPPGDDRTGAARLRRPGAGARRRSSADLRAGAGRPWSRRASTARSSTGLVATGSARGPRERHGLDTVALTGGVFANTLLSSACAARPARRTASPSCATAWSRRTTADWRSAS